jgi:hypothetical protein
MKYILVLICILASSAGYGQQQVSENQYENYYSSKEQQWSGGMLATLIDSVHFQGINKMKKYDTRFLKTLFLSLDPPAWKQLNIDADYRCSTQHDDMLQLWNLNYVHLTVLQFNAWCKGCIILMLTDGLLKG